MKIAIIGTGYVGLTTGTCFAELGHKVICVDIDKTKIVNLKKGVIPIFEPGLKKLVAKNIKQKRLSFSLDTSSSIKFADIVFSAVGTPEDSDHRADLTYVKEVAKKFGQTINGYKIFINKSTIPVGTTNLCQKIIENEIKKRKLKTDFGIASNPEFLREGSAIKDTLNPDRIIVGLSDKKSKNEKTKKIIQTLYSSFEKKKVPIIYTNFVTAETIKYASNAFLATKISFINEIWNFAKKTKGDIKTIAKGMGLDKRIGKEFLNAGIGYGGSCFPKDVKALLKMGKDFGYNFKIIKATEEVNNFQKRSLYHELKKHFSSLKNKRIAILGLAFKPNTDDMREAPSITIINLLLKDRAFIQAYDPAAGHTAKKIFSKPLAKKHITYFSSPYDAAKKADALLILTEWEEFKKLNLKKIRSLMKNPLILDGRNIF